MEGEQILVDQLEDELIDHPDSYTRELLESGSLLDETFQSKLNARADFFTHTYNHSGKYPGLGHFNDSNPNNNTNTTSNNSNNDNNDNNPNINDDNENNTNGSSQDYMYQILVEKLRLLYEHRDHDTLDTEISEWFSYNDLKILQIIDNSNEDFESSQEPYERLASSDLLTVRLDIESLLVRTDISYYEITNEDSTCLKNILYFGLGVYNERTSKNDQVDNIVENIIKLYNWGFLKYLALYLSRFIHDQMLTSNSASSDLGSADNSDSNSSAYSSLSISTSTNVQRHLFSVLTLFYLTLNVYLLKPEGFPGIRTQLAKYDLITLIIQFLEFWKFHPNPHYRVRYFIQILWKLLLVEFGDSVHLKDVDEFLNKHHGIVTKDQISNQIGKKLVLNSSPLDYFTFRDDILSKYPLFAHSRDKVSVTLGVDDFSTGTESNTTKYDIAYKDFMAINETSNSLSNLLEIPKTNRSHSISLQLPSQTIHIATPVPSPPSTPSDYMTGGEKIRKLYQLNQAMPFVYPITDDVSVPYAIKEADEILRNSLHESRSNKQLWSERQKFMKQERGFLSQYPDIPDEDEFDYTSKLYDTYPERKSEIESLLRVEQVFSKSLVSLNSLIEVLLGSIKSNKYDNDLNFLEWELNNNHPEEDAGVSIEKIRYVVMQQLEVANIKETTAKASSAILLLLLEWFEKSHVLKHWYFSSILFDLQFLPVMIEFLETSLLNTNLQQSDEENLASNTNGHKQNVNFNDFEAKRHQNKVFNPKVDLPNFEFFNNCLGSSASESHSSKQIELINKIPFSKMNSEIDSRVSNILVTSYNSSFCFTLVNILKIADTILLDNKTQRVLTLSDLKPSNLLKILVSYNNNYINEPILSMLKKLVPYQGRKWKSNNMELISQIYLNCKLNLRDSWLSGRDVENDFSNSYGQEIALRGLLQFYNLRRYPFQMESMGYELLSNDFEALALNLDE